MTSKTADLANLLALVDQGYQFTPETYSDLNHIDPQKFGLTHSILHIIKSLGIMAAEAEIADHGGEMHEEALKLAAKKQFVNVLKLAAHLGLSAEDLRAHVLENYN